MTTRIGKYEIRLQPDEFYYNDDDAIIGECWELWTCNRRNINFLSYAKLVELEEREAEGDCLLWWLDVYEHGTVHYSLTGSGTQCRFDTARRGAVLVLNLDDHWRAHLSTMPEADKRELAAGVCEEFTYYHNGWMIGWEVVDTEIDEVVDSCWGYLGCYEDQAMAEAKATVEWFEKRDREEAFKCAISADGSD